MKVSVVISTRNRAHTLSRALTSALKQSYSDFEIIVADDASTDNTQDVVRDFMNRDNRIKYFRQEERIGIAPTWKKSFFEYASGELITVLNDDDEFVDGEFITKAVKLFKKYEKENVASVFSNVVYKIEKIDAEDVGYPDGFSEFNNGGELFFGDKFIFTDNGSIYKKAALLDLDLFNENISSLDLELLYKLMLVGNFCYLDSITYKHYLNDDCMSLYAPENIIKNFESTRWIKIVADFALKNGLDENGLMLWQQKRYSAILQMFFTHYEASFDYKYYINNFYKTIKRNSKVVIYGTAEAGRIALENIQKHRKDLEVVGFLDDFTIGEFFGIPILDHKSIKSDYIIVIPSANLKAIATMRESMRENKISNEVVDITKQQL